MRSVVFTLGAVALATAASAQEWVVDLRPELARLGLSPKRQGPRGTCSVFAVCSVAEYEWARATGEAVPLSEEFLNWARHRVVPGRDDGGFFHKIVPGLQRYGLCAQELMPYQKEFIPELPPSPQALADAAPRRGTECHWVKKPGSDRGLSDEEREVALAALRDGHPIAIGLAWYKGKDCLGDGGLLDMEAVKGTGGGHSVILVGYRLDDGLPGGGAFLVRNNAGPGFADGGYLQMPFEWFSKHAHDALWLEPLQPGAISVSSEPPGAQVVVGGMWRGQTPHTFGEMPAGWRRVRIGLSGHWCVEREVAVHANETVEVGVELRAGGPPPVGEAGATWTHEPSGVAFVAVPVPQDEPARLVLQAPAPAGPFWIARTEVSNRQYEAFVGAAGYAPQGDWQYKPEAADLPAAQVTYDDAAAFCAWLGGRLPTEGEWEWAARGPALPPFPWGAVADLDLYVGGGTTQGGRAQPVDILPDGASWCGALNLVGNVSEWCHPLLPGTAAEQCRLHWGRAQGERAALRGGSYVHGGAACRPTWRFVGKRSGHGALDGFRPAIPAMWGGA